MTKTVSFPPPKNWDWTEGKIGSTCPEIKGDYTVAFSNLIVPNELVGIPLRFTFRIRIHRAHLYYWRPQEYWAGETVAKIR
jgi:hypothetical protein